MTREEAIEIIVREEFYNTDASVWEKMPEVKEALDMAIEALQENESLAKSVNEASELLRKKRPHGEWIECEDSNYRKCSHCGTIVMSEEADDFDYCPNCGADMRVKDELNRVSKELNSDNTTLLYSITNGENFIGKEGEAE